MGISQYPFGSQGNLRRKRNCLHEIATAPLGPRNDKPLAFTVLSAACTGRQYRAGSGLQWQVHASGAAPNLRAVHGASGTPHPTTRHRYFNNTPQKCSLSFLRLHFLSAESEKMRASGARSFCSGRQGGAGRKAQTPPSGVGMMSYCQTIYGRSAQNLARFLEHFYEIDFVVIQSVDIPVSSGV